jgi:hypothetical protein
MPRPPLIDQSILEAALVGLQAQRDTLDAKIAAVRSQLRTARKDQGAPAPHVADGTVPQRRRRMSAAARKRIADATRKRWAAYRAQQTRTAKKT